MTSQVLSMTMESFSTLCFALISCHIPIAIFNMTIHDDTVYIPAPEINNRATRIIVTVLQKLKTFSKTILAYDLVRLIGLSFVSLSVLRSATLSAVSPSLMSGS